MLPRYPERVRRQFARNLLHNTLRLTRGENLLVETWDATLPWAVSVTLEARAMGARPLLSVKDEASYWRSLTDARSSQLGKVGDHEWAALRSSDAFVSFYGPMDAEREERLPPAAQRRLQSNNHELMRTIQKYGVRTVRWDLGRTSELWARRYGVNLATWRSELVQAASVDPRRLRKEGLAVGERLRKGRELRISHPNGTDLSLRLGSRRAKLDDGVIDKEDLRAGDLVVVIPSGVVSTTLVETFAEGTFVPTGTGALWTHEEEGHLPPGRWTFHEGALADFAIPSDGVRLRRELRRLGNPRVPVGQISVGLNRRISSIPLLFDQEYGTLTLEIGRNAHLGGRSRVPHLLAFLPLRGGTMEIDGEPVVVAGRLAAK